MKLDDDNVNTKFNLIKLPDLNICLDCVCPFVPWICMYLCV